MNAGGLLISLFAVGGILLVFWLAGWGLAAALLPSGRAFRSERVGWGFACGIFLIAAGVAASFAAGVRPGWVPFLLLFGILFAVARRFLPPLPVGEGRGEGETLARLSVVCFLLLGLTLLGVALYLLRALTEPMWSNDFMAIWGFKAKTIFGDAGIPKRLFEWPTFAFSHPEYPLGLPLVCAGVAFLLGRWEDHALALLFPLWLVATLFVLYGWLRRRGASRLLALGAAVLLAHFEPLYSAFLTGMAEVPLSFAFLLVGTALSDALDRTDGGATRRLALASLIAAATKNEGLFLIGVALVLLLLLRLARRVPFPRAVAAALFLPAALSVLFHRVALGGHRLRDLDFSYLVQPGFTGRVAETLRAEAGLYLRPTWLVLFGVIVLLLALSPRTPHADRLLVLAGVSLAAYLVLPAFCVNGPLWLVTWTLERATAALAPLVAAGVAARLVGVVRRPPVSAS